MRGQEVSIQSGGMPLQKAAVLIEGGYFAHGRQLFGDAKVDFTDMPNELLLYADDDNLVVPFSLSFAAATENCSNLTATTATPSAPAA